MNFKKIAAVSTAAALMAAAVPVTASARTFMKGGKYNAMDVTAMLKDIAGIEKLSDEDFAKADINNDGRISALDVTLVLKKVAGVSDDDTTSVTIKGVKYPIATTTKIDLRDSGITNEDIKEISKLENLNEVLLGGNEITDLTPLSELTKLEILFIDCNFNLSDITPLTKITSLTWVSMALTGITDIKPLASLKNLETLDLAMNDISQSDLKWLENQLPNCNIIFFT